MPCCCSSRSAGVSYYALEVHHLALVFVQDIGVRKRTKVCACPLKAMANQRQGLEERLARIEHAQAALCWWASPTCQVRQLDCRSQRRLHLVLLRLSNDGASSTSAFVNHGAAGTRNRRRCRRSRYVWACSLLGVVSYKHIGDRVETVIQRCYFGTGNDGSVDADTRCSGTTCIGSCCQRRKCHAPRLGELERNGFGKRQRWERGGRGHWRACVERGRERRCRLGL